MHNQLSSTTYQLNDRWAIIIGVPIISFVVPLLFFEEQLWPDWQHYLQAWMVSFLFTISYWLSTRAIVLYFRRRWPEFSRTMRRIVLTGFWIALTYFFLSRLIKGVILVLGIHPEHNPNITDIDYNTASILIIALVWSIYEAVFMYERWRDSLLEAEQLRRENIQSQLDGLKSQVNPHFLFNSLNTLVYLIPEDPNRAVQFVERMAKVYRYILEIQNKPLISLGEELTFLKSYFFLLQARFGDNLRVEFDTPVCTSVQWQVVPLALQLLLENVIKHNIISSDKPLTITCRVEADSFIMINNLQRKLQVSPGTQVGLQNIMNRYAFFTDRTVIINETEEHFSVTLPLLPPPKSAA